MPDDVLQDESNATLVMLQKTLAEICEQSPTALQNLFTHALAPLLICFNPLLLCLSALAWKIPGDKLFSARHIFNVPCTFVLIFVWLQRWHLAIFIIAVFTTVCFFPKAGTRQDCLPDATTFQMYTLERLALDLGIIRIA